MNGVLETRRQIIYNRRDSGVAFLLLDCATKLNYLGAAVMRELDECLAQVTSDSSVKALVLMSGKADNFIIGADIYEIRKATSEEQLYKLSQNGHHTLNTVASMNKPVVVAINGACLGGGLELALSGHWRIATTDPRTLLGLPETRLGIIPGLGGTQRLPRLVGLKSALAMILSADAVKVEEALQMGLVDETCSPDDLMRLAEQRAAELAVSQTEQVSERMKQAAELLIGADKSSAQTSGAAGVKATKWCLHDLDEEKAAKLFAMTERSIRIKTRGHYPAQTRVIDVIKKGLNEGFVAGLEYEAKLFSELAIGDVAGNLISLFFATDFAKQSAASLAAKFGEENTRTVGIIGGGLMGASIAALSADSGMDVLVRVNEGREAQTLESVRSHQKHSRQETEEPNAPSVRQEERSPVRAFSTFAELSDAQIVLESVTEDLQLKTSVLQEVERAVGPECTIASNTSSLPLSELSEALQKTDRFVGIHFFHPAEKMTLVEIVALKTTSRKAVARAADYVIKLGKIPIMVKDGPGFLINRLLTCYLLEMARMAQEGIPLNWIDEAAVDFGMPIGPLELLDEVGLELAVTIANGLHAAFGARMTPPEILHAVPKLGLVGKKNGNGLYIWDENGRRKEFNPELAKLPQLVISPDKADPEKRRELAERLIYPMIDEAARCLEDRIVMKPREIDMAIIHGIGFPPFRGGILKYADRVGLKEVATKLQQIFNHTTDSERSVAPLLRKYIEEGRGFYSRGGKEEE